MPKYFLPLSVINPCLIYEKFRFLGEGTVVNRLALNLLLKNSNGELNIEKKIQSEDLYPQGLF